MNRLTQTISQIGRKKMLIPFFTGGFPTRKATVELIRAAVDAGSDVVEIGMPFSDPLADGPAIQHSSKVALDNGTSLKTVLEIVAEVRKFSDVPLVLMGYFNPLLAMGESRFCRAARKAGADGLIIPDLPIEEAEQFSTFAQKSGLSMIFLVAPTTSRERITEIDFACDDLVYAVTVTGVTGTGKKFDENTARYLRHLRRSLSKPFVAGFGVSSPETAVNMCRAADGVVIGSALVEIIQSARNVAAAAKQVGRFLKSVRKSI